MSLMVLDKRIAEELLTERRAWGGDHHDEVWDGVYMMSPLPNNEHQELVVLGTFSQAAAGQMYSPDSLPGKAVSGVTTTRLVFKRFRPA